MSRTETAGRWRELGYYHAPDAGAARAQHDELRKALEQAGAEVYLFPSSETASLDAVYTHDASIVTDFGAIVFRMGKPARAGEGALHAAFYRGLSIPILGEIAPAGTVESGDLVWLDPSTLLAGLGYRTNRAGIESLRALLAPRGVDVIGAHLPHGPGPEACLHLMSLMSILDERTALVDLAWLSVPTVELLREREFELIPIVSEERDTLCCNVLALGEKRLLAIEENLRTNDMLRERGFEVWTFPGTEICRNGSGGPTCLTRALLRD